MAGGYSDTMTIGGALFLIGLGAILRFAVVDRMDGVNLAAVGAIMIWIGLIGLVVAVILSVIEAIRGRGRRPVDDRW